MKIYTMCFCLFLLGISSLVQGQENASLSWGGSDSPTLRTLSSLAEFTGNALSGDVLGSVESGADLIAASANALSSEPAQRSGMLSNVTRQATRISNRISQLRSAAGNDDYLTARQIVALYLEAYPNDLLYQYFLEGGGEVLIKPLSWGATYWSYHWSNEIHFDNSWVDSEWNRQEAVRHLRNHLEAMADENGSAINKHLTTWDGDIEAFLDRIAAAGVPLGVVFSPKQMTSSQLEGLNEAIVETYRLVPYLGGFVLTFELASGQTLSFTVYGQRELTTGEKWLIIGTPAAGFAAGVLVKVGGKWVFRQITKRVDDLADLAPRRSGVFLKGENITKRWVETLTGKHPDDVAYLLARKGWTKSNPQAAFPDKIQHTVFTRTTKAGDTYILDFHPGGGIHQSEYWKVYKVVNGEKVVFGRIGTGRFENFGQITDSPVFIDGILRN